MFVNVSIRDAVNRLYRGVLYFTNVIPFVEISVNNSHKHN